jgi:hypothetical protein
MRGGGHTKAASKANTPAPTPAPTPILAAVDIPALAPKLEAPATAPPVPVVFAEVALPVADSPSDVLATSWTA